MDEILKIIHEIENQISKHKKYIYYCLSYCGKNNRYKGYTIYAYGNPLIDIFILSAGNIRYSFRNKKDYTDDVKRCLNDNNAYNNGSCIEELLKSDTNKCKIWDKLLEQYKKKGSNGEKARATAIAREHINTNHNLQIIDMEANFKLKKTKENRFVDLLGRQRNNGEDILYLIEFKCTHEAMQKQSLQNHVKDYLKIINKKTYFNKYDNLYKKNSKHNTSFKQMKKEILILVSPYLNNNGELSYESYIYAFKEIIKENNESQLDRINVCLLNNDNLIIKNIIPIKDFINI